MRGFSFGGSFCYGFCLCKCYEVSGGEICVRINRVRSDKREVLGYVDISFFYSWKIIKLERRF